MDCRGLTLIHQLQVRNQQALGRLYDHLAPLVNAMLFHILGEQADVDEVLGETFFQVWESAATYDPLRGSVEAWVLTIARSRALDRLRTRKRQAALMEAWTSRDSDPSPSAPTPETTTLQEEHTRAVAMALATLPEEHRRLIELAYYGGLSQSQIAAQLGQPLGTIKTRMRMGLSLLRKVLKPYGGSAHDA